MARLSVVVPFYGVEQYLDRCLRSIAHQTFTDLEVVLVDDGSTDGSLRIAERWASQDPRFTVVRQENQGLGPARNTGVRRAGGELLAFVDGDDLLPRHAYELLVAALDESGSDLAGGDARRFTSLWARDSYTHRDPFAETVLGTHVSRRPSLVRDRMAWNKVYRRDFWDRHAFVFPAMLYEDYPVTFPAHVLARSVDVLEQPVYFWREREGGEPSITQARHTLPNLRDRVRSAGMVLDLAADDAPELQADVEAYLFHVDLDAVVAALFRADTAQQPEIVALARTLLARVRPRVREEARPVERLQAALLENGDLPRILELLAHRDRHGSSATVLRTRLVPPRFAYDLPFRQDRAAELPSSVFAAPRPVEATEVRLTTARWCDGRLRLHGVVRVPDAADADRVSRRLTLRLAHPSGRVVEVAAAPDAAPARRDGTTEVGFAATVNPFDLGRPPRRGRWSLRARTGVAGAGRDVAVRVDPASPAAWVRPEPVGSDLVVQPMPVAGGEVVLDVRPAHPRVIRVTALADEVEVEIVLASAPDPDDPPVLVLAGGDRTHRVPLISEPVEEGRPRVVGRIGLGALDPWPFAPDPVEEAVPWTVRLELGGRARPVPVSHRVVGATARSATQQLHVSRTSRGNLGATVGPVTAEVDVCRWVDDALRVEGAQVDGRARQVALEMHCQVDPETRLVRTFDAFVHGGTFAGTVDVGELLVACRTAGARPDDRPYAWRGVLVEDGRPGRLVLPRPSLERAPAARVVDGAEVEVRSGRAAALTVQVRLDLSG